MLLWAYLSTLSEKLNETARCIYASDGNSSEVCEGALALTLYNPTSKLQSGPASGVSGQPAFYGTAALITLSLTAIL